MKHQKKQRDRYSSDLDSFPEIELDPDDTDYAWRFRTRAPWRKRWLDDHDSRRRFRDNEGWDDDGINEIRWARKPYGRTGRNREQFYDAKDE